VDGLVNEREDMSETEQKELDANVQPIRRVSRVASGVPVAAGDRGYRCHGLKQAVALQSRATVTPLMRPRH
jgi:hypothetical protein